MEERIAHQARAQDGSSTPSQNMPCVWVLVVVSVPVNIDQKDGLVQLAFGSQSTYNMRFGRPAAHRDLTPDSFDVLWASMVCHAILSVVCHFTHNCRHFLDKAMN